VTPVHDFDAGKETLPDPEILTQRPPAFALHDLEGPFPHIVPVVQSSLRLAGAAYPVGVVDLVEPTTSRHTVRACVCLGADNGRGAAVGLGHAFTRSSGWAVS